MTMKLWESLIAVMKIYFSKDGSGQVIIYIFILLHHPKIYPHSHSLSYFRSIKLSLTLIQPPTKQRHFFVRQDI